MSNCKSSSTTECRISLLLAIVSNTYHLLACLELYSFLAALTAARALSMAITASE